MGMRGGMQQNQEIRGWSLRRGIGEKRKKKVKTVNPQQG